MLYRYKTVVQKENRLQNQSLRVNSSISRDTVSRPRWRETVANFETVILICCDTTRPTVINVHTTEWVALLAVTFENHCNPLKTLYTFTMRDRSLRVTKRRNNVLLYYVPMPISILRFRDGSREYFARFDSIYGGKWLRKLTRWYRKSH